MLAWYAWKKKLKLNMDEQEKNETKKIIIDEPIDTYLAYIA
jgi:hypothetical protein